MRFEMQRGGVLQRAAWLVAPAGHRGAHPHSLMQLQAEHKQPACCPPPPLPPLACMQHLESLLTERTRVVSVVHVSNMPGSVTT